MHRHYYTCRSNIGKKCTIRTVDGRIYTGAVTRVTREHVYLSEIGRGISGNERNAKIMATTADGENSKGKGSEVFFFGSFAVPLAAIVGLTIVGTAPFWGRSFYGYGGGYGYGYGSYGYGRRRFF